MTGPARLVLCAGLVLGAGALGFASPASTEPPKAGAPRGHRGITDQLDCSACHTPAGWKTLSEGPAGGGFNHDRTGFPLRGEHRRTSCTECHQAGRKLTRECDGCHEDAHQGRLSSDCSECHNASTWLRTDAIERHRMTRLPLSGMHALTDCTDCHRRTSDRAWSSVQADCYSCHADDYRRSDVHPVHVGSASSTPFDRNCAACHRASGWTPAVIAIGTFNQALSAPNDDHDARFPIRFGVHRGAECSDCHAQEDGKGQLQCTGCHVHGPLQLRKQHPSQLPPTTGRACLGCHPGGVAR